MRRKSKSKPRYYSLSRKDPHVETKKKYGERAKPPAATRHILTFQHLKHFSLKSNEHSWYFTHVCTRYSYHAWWRTDKIRNNFSTKTESEKINKLNELKALLPFLSFKTSRLALNG